MGFKRLFILMLLSTSLLNAQSDFKPAYIIKHSADTLYGEVDNRGELTMGTTCKFKSQEGSIYEYSPNEITAFRFIDSKYYVSREVNGKKVFLQYLINGEVDLYYLRDREVDHYFLDKEGEKLLEIPYEEKYKYSNGRKFLQKSNKHIGVLNVYMKDAPNFQSQIIKIKKPGHRNLMKLTREYHNIVNEKEKSIIYEKKTVIIVNFEFVGGILNFTNTENIKGINHSNLGFLLHIGMPWTNEKIYFKTGYLYSSEKKLSLLSGNEKSYTIPLHIGYIGPSSRKIRPSVSIGLLSTSYSAGLFTKLSKKTYAGLQSWLEFEAGGFGGISWVPSKLNNYSIMGSILIEL